jgi:hypothetical protein
MAEKGVDQETGNTYGASGDFLSGKPAKQEERSFTPWIIAGIVVIAIIGGLIFAGMRPSKQAANTPDPYAAQLAISGVQLSTSSNMAGSQLTYVDGQITNQGDKTVDGITVRATFHDSLNQPGQQETMRLSLIRTRDPYIDIEPVSADPIKPGESKPFRLIFDHVSQDWNQQNPDIQILQVHFRP